MANGGERSDLASLIRQIAGISADHAGYLTQLQKQVASASAITDALAKSVAVDRAVVSSVSAALSQMRQFTALAPRTNAMLGANIQLSRIVEQIASATSRFPAALVSGSDVIKILQSSGASASLAASLAQMDRTRMLSASLVAQQKLGALDGVRLGSLVGADATFRRSTAAHLGRLTRSYEQLITVTANQPSPTAHLPILTAYPPVECLRHVEAVASVSVAPTGDEDIVTDVNASLDEAVPRIDDILPRVDSSLGRLLNGAREALTSKNPDRARHVTTSLRELFTHVLHALASDDAVNSWTSQPDHFHNGRPTRRARLLYICRHIDEGAFTAFVQNDVSATLSFVDSLSANTHTVEAQLTPAQLGATVARMESLLVFLLQVGDGGLRSTGT